MENMDTSHPTSSGEYAMVLLGLAAVLGVLSIRARYQQKLEERREAGTELMVTDDFRIFQGMFIRVYLAALATDWLQAAYLFVVLREYHPEQFVVRMYLAGVTSQLSMSLLLELMGGFIPHKFRCAACLALQAGSACLMLHPAFGGLVTSRVFGGFASALLHSAFEAWMVEQHVGQGFPLEWITDTFNRTAMAMSALSILLGPAATVAHDFGGGNLGPFNISLLLIGVNALQLIGWRRDPNKPFQSCADTGRLATRAWNALSGERDVVLVAVAQACFEAGTFAFALLWTPLLDAAAKARDPSDETPWGLAFSQQLACVMIGSVLFKITASTSPFLKAERMCFAGCMGGALSFAALSSGQSLGEVQAGLLAYELSVGVYINAMGMVRSKYIPQEVRGLITTGSKLVATTLLFVVLLFISESRTVTTAICGILSLVGALTSALAGSGATAEKGEGMKGVEDGLLSSPRR